MAKILTKCFPYEYAKILPRQDYISILTRESARFDFMRYAL